MARRRLNRLETVPETSSWIKSIKQISKSKKKRRRRKATLGGGSVRKNSNRKMNNRCERVKLGRSMGSVLVSLCVSVALVSFVGRRKGGGGNDRSASSGSAESRLRRLGSFDAVGGDLL